MSSDGITAQPTIDPSQIALAQYDFGQGVTQARSQFAEMPHSTNLTQAISGAQAKKALDIGQMSQADTAAMQNFLNQNLSNFTGLLGQLLGK